MMSDRPDDADTKDYETQVREAAEDLAAEFLGQLRATVESLRARNAALERLGKAVCVAAWNMGTKSNKITPALGRAIEELDAAIASVGISSHAGQMVAVSSKLD